MISQLYAQYADDSKWFASLRHNLVSLICVFEEHLPSNLQSSDH
jgi:hypothetical protein